MWSRKIRSQTSDNMERWKSRGGESQRREEKKKEDQRRERVRRQKMQVREKVKRNTVFFQWFVAPEGRRVGSLKRRVRSRLGRCSTPLWREAHFEVKSVRNWRSQTTWDDEKVHAVVARSTFRSQNAQSAAFSEHFWKLRCRKSARRCGAKRVSKSKCKKHYMLGPLWRFRCGFAWQAQWGSAKWAKREGFVACPKTMAGVGIWRGTGQMHVAWQAQCKRHVHQRC